MNYSDYTFGNKLDNEGLFDIADLWDSFISKYPNVRTASITNPYEILGISSGASLDEIKLAYKMLARKHHPDVNPNDREGAAKRFRAINEAYEALSSGSYKPQGEIANFINQNHEDKFPQHLSREDLIALLNGENLSEQRSSHFNDCRRCRDNMRNITRGRQVPPNIIQKLKRTFQYFNLY